MSKPPTTRFALEGEGGAPSPRKRGFKRRQKLIQPRLQLKVIGAFFGVSALSFLLQYLLLGFYLTDAANKLPDGGSALRGELPGLLMKTLILSFCFLLPLTLLIGALVTFRIAGPLYRFEVFLRAVRDRTQTEPCRIRKGDELKDLCELINEATESARTDATSPREDGAGERDLRPTG